MSAAVRLEARLTKTRAGAKLAIFVFVSCPDPEDPEVAREDVLEFDAEAVFADSRISPDDLDDFAGQFPTGFPAPTSW